MNHPSLDEITDLHLHILLRAALQDGRKVKGRSLNATLYNLPQRARVSPSIRELQSWGLLRCPEKQRAESQCRYDWIELTTEGEAVVRSLVRFARNHLDFSTP